jgi:hypothetical protein
MSAISGVAVAKISDITDPQSKGRVLISVPNQSSLGTLWAPVVTAVGPGGQLEEGDEVLVAFESGDLNRPAQPQCIFQMDARSTRSSQPVEQLDRASAQLRPTCRDRRLPGLRQRSAC